MSFSASSVPFSYFVFIALGGAAGALLRYQIFLWIPANSENIFPYATLIANMLGSFLVGIFGALLSANTVPEIFRFLIVIGFLGALTTFSTYAFDIVRLLVQQEYRLATLYFFLNNLSAILLATCGLWLVKIFLR